MIGGKIATTCRSVFFYFFNKYPRFGIVFFLEFSGGEYTSTKLVGPWS